MPRLVINDGYTLPFPEDFPVSGKYRPALPDALADWRYKLRDANSGGAAVTITANFLADHICEWDVTDMDDKPLPPVEMNIRRIPEPVLEKLVTLITGWAGPEQEKAAGN